MDAGGDGPDSGRLCSNEGRFAGGGVGSDGSSFKILIMLERFAGVGLAGSAGGAVGVETVRGGSRGPKLYATCGREMIGDCTGD